MKFMRNHWFDVGGVLALVVLVFLFFSHQTLSHYQALMWLNLVSLFLHQLEEYRIVGTFPGMTNAILNANLKTRDRYPLNTNTSLFVNVFFGWVAYLFAALAGERAIWLGMASIIVSMGNIAAHTTYFNIKSKTIYNAGLATSWLVFAPCVFFFFKIIHQENLVAWTDYLIGIPLGVALNYFGILKLIDWMKDENTPYVFDQRFLLPADRKHPVD